MHIDELEISSFKVSFVVVMWQNYPTSIEKKTNIYVSHSIDEDNTFILFAVKHSDKSFICKVQRTKENELVIMTAFYHSCSYLTDVYI